jgi:hypothetical protein
MKFINEYQIEESTFLFEPFFLLNFLESPLEIMN